jgi:sigma-E factor negative regulatory protein RseA
MDKISALMDGELDAHQSDQQYSRLKHDAEARACWNTYHMIGDALRGERNATDITGRMAAQLAAEPAVLAPRSRRAPAKRVATYAFSAAASLSAVALVGWIAFNNPLAPQPEPSTVASSAPAVAPAVPAVPVSAPAQVASVPASVPSDGKMNEYLIAHQEFSPSTALQGLAPYIRTVSASATQTGKGQ